MLIICDFVQKLSLFLFLTPAAMTTITLQVDDNIGSIYQNISNENKQQFNQVLTLMLQRAANNIKCDKVKKIIEEIKNDPALNNLDPEIVYMLLCSEEDD
jgi:hypothetical protein